MSFRFTLFAGLFLIVAATLYFLDPTPQPPPRRVGLPGLATPRPSPLPVTPVVLKSPKTVRKLVFRTPQGTRATERTADGWSSAERSNLVEDFVHDLTTLGAVDTIPVSDATSLREFGLDPPERVLEVYLADSNEPIEIHFGNLNPPGTNVYLRIPPGNEILLAGALLNWGFERTFQNLLPSGTDDSPVAEP